MKEPLLITNIRDWLNHQLDSHSFNYNPPKEIIVSQEQWNEIDAYYDWLVEDENGHNPYREIYFNDRRIQNLSVKGIRLRVGWVHD